MPTEIQFYHLTSTPLERALPKLLEKALQAGFKIGVRAASDERAEWLNTTLWTYDPASFLPHGAAADGNAQAQPIYITSNGELPNGADLLVVTDGSQLSADASFRRVLDIFDGSDETAVAGARTRWKAYQTQGHAVSYIKQTTSGAWEKQAA